jgi:predicted nucleic acid-binding protein
MDMLLDSSAWIELFIQSEKGKEVKKILETQRCFTSIVSIAEITNWCLKNDRDHKKWINYIEKISQVIPLNKKIVELAGQINFKNKKIIKNWGMLDSLIYSTALIYNLTVLTKDHHFKTLNNVNILD